MNDRAQPIFDDEEFIGSKDSLRFGLEIVRQQMWSKSAKEGVAELCRRLDAGEPLPEAIEATRDRLPHGVAELLSSSGHDAQFPAIIDHFIRESVRERRGTWELVLALVYPVILLAFSMALFVVIAVYVLPQFEDLYEEIYGEFQRDLPRATVIVLQIGKLLRFAWPVIAVVLVLVGIAAVLFAAGAVPSPLAWRAIRYLPLLVDGIVYSSMSQFCDLLAILLRGRVPLPSAIRTAAASIRDLALRAEVEELADAVEAGLVTGADGTESVYHSGDLRRLFGQVHDERDLIDSLRTAASVFAARARFQIGMLLAVVEPLTLIFIGFTISIIVIALFFPNIKLLNDLS